MKVSWDDDIPNIRENEKCSKPPTRKPLELDWRKTGERNSTAKIIHVIQGPGITYPVHVIPTQPNYLSLGDLGRARNAVAGAELSSGCAEWG